MKKKPAPAPITQPEATNIQSTTTEKQKPERHADADYVQKTHFGYVGAYA